MGGIKRPSCPVCGKKAVRFYIRDANKVYIPEGFYCPGDKIVVEEKALREKLKATLEYPWIAAARGGVSE